ncbi:hypothetical protein BGW80DRAFT_295683 [Lactifluus volemus]|nr:hypothetical protein BGW80DRAFT_295683 [Lactifluus volemus]
MVAESSSIPPDISRITGPFLFGPMINWALYGVLCVQAYVYSYNFPDDKRWLKFLCCFVFLLETAQTALTGVDVYRWFITGFGNLDSLRNPNVSAIDSPTMSGIVSLIVQLFYCYRIWTLRKQLWWLSGIIAILSVTQVFGALWGGLKAAIRGTFGSVKTPAPYLWLITSAVVDILIAVAMLWLLRNTRTNENEGRFSSYVLPRVVRLTVETNLLTATVAIISFVLFVALPNEIYYTCPTMIIGKLYSNTLFVTLNNRIYFRDRPFPGSMGDDGYLERGSHPQASIGATRRPLATVPPKSPQSSTTNHTSESISLDEAIPNVEAERKKDYSSAITVSSEPTDQVEKLERSYYPLGK